MHVILYEKLLQCKVSFEQFSARLCIRKYLFKVSGLYRLAFLTVLLVYIFGVLYTINQAWLECLFMQKLLPLARKFLEILLLDSSGSRIDGSI